MVEKKKYHAAALAHLLHTQYQKSAVQDADQTANI